MRKAVIILTCIVCLGAILNRNTFKDDISNRSIVQGVGIDINDDGTYTVTLEIINTENYSNADGTAKPVMNLRTLNGKTVSSAIKSAYAIDGKTPVLSQNRVIVIGKKLAEQGIMPSLDFFIRGSENYPTVQIATVEGKAEDFFKDASGETTVVSRNIEDILMTSEEDMSVSSITLCDLVNHYKSAGASFYMPIISTFEGKEKKEITSKGTAVFKEGKLVCNLSEEETASLNFLCNCARRGAVDFSYNGVPASISVIQNSTKKKVDYSSENPQFFFKVKIKADLAEIDSETVYNPTQTEVDAMKECAEEKIKSDIESLCRKLYRQEKADPLGFSRLIYIYYPEKFRAQEKNLSEIMTNSQYSVEVEICIRRLGQDYSS